MGVCRFFLNGYCKFGSNCFNDHPSGGNQGYSVTAQRQLFGGGGGGNSRGGGRGGGGSGGGGYQNPQGNPYRWNAKDAQPRTSSSSTQQMAAGDIVKGLATEVTSMWDIGKMWPFSCMGFEKDMPSLPGLTDISMEELRYEAYEALKQGNIQPYLQKLESSYNEVLALRKELKSPNMTLKQSLTFFIEDSRKKAIGQGNLVSLFSDSDKGSLFGGSSSSSGPFGQSLENSLFGQTATGNQSGGLFSQSATGNQSGGLFGQSATGNQSGGLFGKSSAGNLSGGLFGQTGASSAASEGLFGKSGSSTAFGQTGSQSLFGQTGSQTGFSSQPMVGQTAGASLFGQTGSDQSTGSFGQTGVSSLFGQTAQANTSLFGQTAQANQSVFGQTAQPTFGQSTSQQGGLFGNPVQPAPETSRKSLFGSADPNMDSTSMVATNKAAGNEATVLRSSSNALPTIGSGSTVQRGASPQSADNTLNSVYTSIDQLTTVEREQFEAQTFTVGLIPTRPPPKELCM
ncbi:uncharacterized protein LOC127841888 isoform X2 [Dreissena polymorpha]|uniref:uncharacterized protein LOC127841888 isoform X2 n=1 Tax=Dreissena polymorpha TaxID=45954 RepID=UPI002263DA1F|nr:uncharacterized protein LOC127841888 isoform X2 [Dreissena polymorpha]